MALGEGEIPGVTALPLCKLQYRIVAPACWGERLRGAQWQDLAALPWISTPKDGSHSQMAETLFRRHRFTPQKVIEADSEASIASLVLANIGMGLMREDLAAQAHEDGRMLMLEMGGATTSLRFIYLGSRENDPAILALRTVLGELWPRPRSMPLLRTLQQVSVRNSYFAWRRAVSTSASIIQRTTASVSRSFAPQMSLRITMGSMP
jgi:DNA-binding transcriptional LysR family regulator